MHRKQVLFVTNELTMPSACRHALGDLDVQAMSASLNTYQEKFTTRPPELVIADLGENAARDVSSMETFLFENGPIALLVITEVETLSSLHMPVRIPCDFIIRHASSEEYSARIRTLLWPGEESASSDLVRVDALTINLANYQVSISGNPVDFTYLEYALLSFLVTHPGRTYSRDVLLRRVWGFEYTGSSRTVDVHVRRIRAKLGPEYAQHLETVRGVGYFWNE